MYILSRVKDSVVEYALLYIHSFMLRAQRKNFAATQLDQRYEEIENVSDKLRWCRYRLGLTQAEVADRVGMTREAYKAIEEGNTHHIQSEMAERLALFYGMPATEFLDEYNRFLYYGQANRIRKYRESLGLGKKPFARATGIPIRSLQEWEGGGKTVSYRSWERYFKGKA